MIECLNCKKSFEPKRETAKFCSDSCRVMHHRKNKDKKKGEILVSPQSIQKQLNELSQKMDKILYAEPKAVYDAPRIDLTKVQDEAPMFSNPAPKNHLAEYWSKLQKASDLETLELIGAEIQSHPDLSWKDRQNLKNFGQQIAKQKFI